MEYEYNEQIEPEYDDGWVGENLRPNWIRREAERIVDDLKVTNGLTATEIVDAWQKDDNMPYWFELADRQLLIRLIEKLLHL